MLSEREKQEFKDPETGKKLADDLQKMRNNRYNPFLVDGKVDVDKYICFLDQYNAFINHKRPPFKKMIDKDMRL